MTSPQLPPAVMLAPLTESGLPPYCSGCGALFPGANPHETWAYPPWQAHTNWHSAMAMMGVQADTSVAMLRNEMIKRTTSGPVTS